MLLFIFESVGTSELILIGIVALMFLGPRKLPEIARKIGKITAEFRGTANEFKQTWQREVDFEEEAKALDIKEIDDEVSKPQPVSRTPSTPPAPAVKQIDRAEFDRQMAERNAEADEEDAEPAKPVADDKRNWL